MIDDLMAADECMKSGADAGSMRRWVQGYFSRLPTADMGDDLLRTLFQIAKNSFFTTFLDDYDINAEGIGLDALARFPRERVEPCLSALNACSTNFFIPHYVDKFREKYYGIKNKSV